MAQRKVTLLGWSAFGEVEMSRNTDTQRLEKPMSYLLNRKGRYYLNLRVPTELRQFYKCVVIRESLHTSDYRKATEESAI